MKQPGTAHLRRVHLFEPIPALLEKRRVIGGSGGVDHARERLAGGANRLEDAVDVGGNRHIRTNHPDVDPLLDQRFQRISNVGRGLSPSHQHQCACAAVREPCRNHGSEPCKPSRYEIHGLASHRGSGGVNSAGLGARQSQPQPETVANRELSVARVRPRQHVVKRRRRLPFGHRIDDRAPELGMLENDRPRKTPQWRLRQLDPRIVSGT